MEVRALEIPEVKLITPRIHRDARGFFSEAFNAREFAQAIGVSATFVQDNHSLSVDAGVVRGLHFQAPPHAQGKLVRVVRGAIFDIALDIRQGSPTYARHVSTVLSTENWTQIWVPIGFAHGFCTLEPNTEVIYKTTDYYAPHADMGIAWNDQALGIAWPVGPESAILSAKDQRLPPLAELAACFRYGA